MVRRTVMNAFTKPPEDRTSLLMPTVIGEVPSSEHGPPAVPQQLRYELAFSIGHGGRARPRPRPLRHEHDVVRLQVEILLRRATRRLVVVERDSNSLVGFWPQDDNPGP